MKKVNGRYSMDDFVTTGVSRIPRDGEFFLSKDDRECVKQQGRDGWDAVGARTIVVPQATVTASVQHLRYGMLGGQLVLAPKHTLKLLGATIRPQGGVSIVTLSTGQRGISRCRADENFSKARGRSIAYNRAQAAV